VRLKRFSRRNRSRFWDGFVGVFWPYISIDTFSTTVLCLVCWWPKGCSWWTGSKLYHPVFINVWLKWLLPSSSKGFVFVKLMLLKKFAKVWGPFLNYLSKSSTMFGHIWNMDDLSPLFPHFISFWYGVRGAGYFILCI